MSIEFRSRKVQEGDRSLWITLPFEWTQHHSRQKGDVMTVKLGENGQSLIVEPKEEKND